MQQQLFALFCTTSFRRQDWFLCHLWQFCILHLGLLWRNKISIILTNFPFLPKGKCPTIEVFFLTQNSIFIHHIIRLHIGFQFLVHSWLPYIFVNMISFDIGIDLGICFNNDRNEIIFIDKNVSNLKCHFQLSLKHWKTM